MKNILFVLMVLFLTCFWGWLFYSFIAPVESAELLVFLVMGAGFYYFGFLIVTFLLLKVFKYNKKVTFYVPIILLIMTILLTEMAISIFVVGLTLITEVMLLYRRFLIK